MDSGGELHRADVHADAFGAPQRVLPLGGCWPRPAVLHGTPSRHLYAGRDPSQAVTIDDLRAMAHRRLPEFALEYLEGGAEDELTLSRNRAALAELRLRPRALVDVAQRELSVTLLDRPRAMPIAVAPTGLNGLYRHDADLLLAQAAADAGIPFVQSTMSNVAMERIAQVPGLQHWWQLYVFGPPGVHRALVDRAAAAGCEALVVTTDAQFYGHREWERRRLRASGWPNLPSMIEAAGHPGWLASMLLAGGMPRFETLLEYLPPDHRHLFRSASWIRAHMDHRLDWATIGEIRERWKGKLLVKGLLDVDDVVRAAEAGADGVVLSNHGGRQLDGTISALDCLARARRAVGPRFTLLADGGIRRGSDVVKALALGADAVLVGRAVLYGVAAAGRAGASRALEILRSELDLTLGLMGLPSVAHIDGGAIERARG